VTDATKGRLLIVDDEVAQMQALCDTLEDHGYQVLGRTHGEAALVALQQAPFDLLLADLMMPGMNGIELLRAALAIDPMLVGIIMTGEGTISTAVEAMQSGALDYILKPFKLSAILPVLGRGLTVRRLQLENAALERRVREHVTELEAANRELDAFTRSASHDLRAPLNVILGFSTLLVTDLGPQIPTEHRNWLSHIERSAQRMNQLIDALMRLSRVGRQALTLQTVDVVALVRSVVDDLRDEQPQRGVTPHIGELPETTADASLLRQLFVNLLSNAFKFTRNTEQAVIEVGCESQGGEQVYFVRDNGAGFDMTHAQRLFDAFQRFHRAEDFEGNGVGLSIAQRIVRRHGGRIWAEAAPGQGASFFFTLARAAGPLLATTSPSPL
jgi:signal transduction histidine kinase